MKKKEKKLEKKLERHKVHSILKEVVDQKEDVEEITITVYQNINNRGWQKVEIPFKRKKK